MTIMMNYLTELAQFVNNTGNSSNCNRKIRHQDNYENDNYSRLGKPASQLSDRNPLCCEIAHLGT